MPRGGTSSDEIMPGDIVFPNNATITSPSDECFVIYNAAKTKSVALMVNNNSSITIKQGDCATVTGSGVYTQYTFITSAAYQMYAGAGRMQLLSNRGLLVRQGMDATLDGDFALKITQDDAAIEMRPNDGETVFGLDMELEIAGGGSGAFVSWYSDMTETSIGTGDNLQADFKVDGTSVFKIGWDGGVMMGLFVGDPCGSLAEGSLFYNDTSDYMCFCNGAGADLKIDGGGACF